MLHIREKPVLFLFIVELLVMDLGQLRGQVG
jgi:hypothetical protein